MSLVKKGAFTFIWRLENISYCAEKKGEPITSPAFGVKDIGGTKWTLKLFVRGNTHEDWISVYLGGVDRRGPPSIEIKYDIAFIGNNYSELISKSGKVTNSFAGNALFGWTQFVKREDVFVTKRSSYLPCGNLTVRCRIWKAKGEMSEIQCFARTQIDVRKISFVVSDRNFSASQSDREITSMIESVGSSALPIYIVRSLTGGVSSFSGGIIRFRFDVPDANIKFCTLRLSLVNSFGKEVECNQEEFWLDPYLAVVTHGFPDPGHSSFSAPVRSSYFPKKEFTFRFTKKSLMELSSLYLPKDTLITHWEMVFSKGIMSSKIEEVYNPVMNLPNACLISESKFSDKSGGNLCLSNLIMDNLKSLYFEKSLCDVELRTSTNAFPAHKVVLAASSPVFKTMFSSYLIKLDYDCVNVNDLDDNTVSEMLLHMYGASVKDLTWKSAFDLFEAADKYAFQSLKDKCCSYLTDNLSPSNACEVLLMADMYHDKGLKSAVQKYIREHHKDVAKSSQWVALLDTRKKLVAETLLFPTG